MRVGTQQQKCGKCTAKPCCCLPTPTLLPLVIPPFCNKGYRCRPDAHAALWHQPPSLPSALPLRPPPPAPYLEQRVVHRRGGDVVQADPVGLEPPLQLAGAAAVHVALGGEKKGRGAAPAVSSCSRPLPNGRQKRQAPHAFIHPCTACSSAAAMGSPPPLLPAAASAQRTPAAGRACSPAAATLSPQRTGGK